MKPTTTNEPKERAEYHLSRKALAQRRKNSRARKGTGKDWVTVKVERQFKDKATSLAGSVNEYLAKRFGRTN